MINPSTPVFTTSRPGLMASTEDRNQEFIDQMTGIRKLADKAKGASIYIDGDLEDVLGYDIPIWLSGNITGDNQDVYIWNVPGTIMYLAEITWGHKGTFGEHTYIRFKEEHLRTELNEWDKQDEASRDDV
jgi:hypothetical protein